MAKTNDPNLKCSFCGKTQDQVKKLIAGPDVLNFATKFWTKNYSTSNRMKKKNPQKQQWKKFPNRKKLKNI